MKPTLRQILPVLDNPILPKQDRLLTPHLDRPLSALRYDSRLATDDTVFFCLVGKISDGHDYADSAYRNGCRIFVAERPLTLPEDALCLVVPDTRIALAEASAEFYGHPERSMRLIGLTGTKGKTTTSLLIRSLLEDAGIPTGYIGTNGVDYKSTHHQTVNSTPESAEIYRYLRYMLDEGVQTCVMEISSQALWMGRTRGLLFDTVLFTNLSRDHIGGVEHPDFEHYRDSKRCLFTDYPTKAVVACADDPHTPYMTQGVTAPLYLYSADNTPAQWRAVSREIAVQDGRMGMSFTALRQGDPAEHACFLPLPGVYNIQNALAALTVVCERFGVSPENAAESLAKAVVNGRFETITHSAIPDVTFIIDYAHNGVSLASVLDAVADYSPRRIICLFGSVGGRSKERRQQLAEAAANRCDLCVLTSDNPGCEPPMDVINEIDASFPEGSCPRVKIADRAEAIRYAVEIAAEGDVILLAGKGHENYQLVGVKRIPFSETRILLRAIEERAGMPVS